jgi:phosphopantothenoylcysteine decarboxylase/phosphopantothenate--cysteine ligase
MFSSEPQPASHVRNIALGVCGGIAAYKAVEVLRGLQKAGCTVTDAMTKRACE